MKDGGPAFPVSGDQVYPEFNGMSLRDWFAGQALMGLLAEGSGSTWERDAENAYRAADAMLAEREKAK